MYPQLLTNFVAFADGKGYVGRVPELTLPKMTSKMLEYLAGGMSAAVEIDTGINEKMETTFTLAEYNAAVLSLWGILAGADTQFTFRGSVQAQGADAQAVVATVAGRIKELDPGTWKPNEQIALKVAIATTYFKLNIAGIDVLEIDPVNMVRIVGGVDQLASQRTALGI